MSRVERNLELIIFLVLLPSFAYFYQGGGANQNARLDQIRSIVELGQLNLKPFSGSHDIVRFEGNVYPNKAPGMSLVGVAPYFLVSRLKSVIIGMASEDFYHLFSCWLVTVLTVGVPSALGGVVFFRLLGLFHPALFPRLICTLGLFLGTPAFAYSTVLYGHMVSTVLTVISFYLLLKYGVLRPGEKHAPLWIALSGLSGGWAVVTEYPTIVIVFCLTLYCFFRSPKKLRFGWFLLGVLLPVGVLLSYDYLVFHNPFYLAYFDKTAGPHGKYKEGFLIGLLWRRETPRALYQTSFGPFRGFFHLSPFLILAFPGVYYFAKRKGKAGLLMTLWLMVLVYFFLNTMYGYWYGGKALGPRHAMEMLPYLCLLGFFFIVRFPRFSAALVGLSIFFILSATAVRPEEYVDPPLRNLYLPAFLSGNLSIKGETTFQRNTVLPDYFNSFNLGEVFGLEGQLSLLPLYLIWLTGGVIMTMLAANRNDGSGEGSPRAMSPVWAKIAVGLLIAILAGTVANLIAQLQLKSALQDLAGAGAFKVAAREAPQPVVQLRTTPGHRLQVWEVRKPFSPGDTLNVKVQHAASGREGGFSILAFGDQNGDGKPDAEIGRSEFLIAQNAGDWSYWTFPAPEGKVFVGNTWDEGARVFFDRGEWKTKDFSPVMFFSNQGPPTGSVSPRCTNMAIEVEAP